MRVRLLNTSRNAATATSPPLLFPPLFDTNTRDRRCLVHPSTLPSTRGLRVSTLRWIIRDAGLGTARNTGRHDREVDHDIRSYVVQHRTGQRTCHLLMRAKILCCVRAGESVVLTAVGLAAGPPPYQHFLQKAVLLASLQRHLQGKPVVSGPCRT